VNVINTEVLNDAVSSVIEGMEISSDKMHYTLVDWIDEIATDIFGLVGGEDWDCLSWFDLLGISTCLLLLHNRQVEQPIHMFDVPDLKTVLQLEEDFDVDVDRLVSTTEAITKWLWRLLCPPASP